MDADLTTLPTPPPYKSDVPYEVYQPLLQIARRGFDANDVKYWYAMILDQVLHAEVPYPVSTSDMSSIALVPSLGGTTTSAADISVASTSYFDDSTVLLDTASDSLAVENHHYITSASPHSAPSTYETASPAYETMSNLSFQASPSWTPSQPATFVSTTDEEACVPINNPSYLTGLPQWTYADALQEYTDTDTDQRKRRMSCTLPFHTSMSTTAMPMLIPTMEPSHSMQGSFYPSICSSSEITYLPPISIIPSRKRRKAGGSKGVKKFIQPLHVSRQSF